MELTSKEHKKLIKQIERLCEKQYRKGVQHGSLVPNNTANIFRHNGIMVGYKRHEHLLTNGSIENYVEMLVGESAMGNMQELQHFLLKGK